MALLSRQNIRQIILEFLVQNTDTKWAKVEDQEILNNRQYTEGILDKIEKRPLQD